MPTPTDRQRTVHERRRAPRPRGLDAVSHHILGWFKRAPRHLKKIKASAERMDQLRQQYAELKDGTLNERLVEMRQRRRANPSDVDETLEEGLALLAVVAHRELGLSPYGVQLMTSAALARGFLTEVETGEGKTLALALTAAYQAWTGRPCHVITANDYLAGRDAEQLEAFYIRAGLSVGRVLGDTTDPDRRRAYGRAVTYTTAKEAAADYLRDRLRMQGLEESGARLALAQMTGAGRAPQGEPVQRGLYFALIDEADNALIDEAVTPLIISRALPAGQLENACAAAWKVAERMVSGVDYEVNRVRKGIEIELEELEKFAMEYEVPEALLWASPSRRAELLRLALEAREFFKKDVQYVVEEGKVVIVDEATGRPMPMRTWRQGLHQMMEAKEGVPLSGASETMARVSFQSFFCKYENLAGASGTVKEVAAEIWRTYGLPTLTIPRHLPSQRQSLGWHFYPSRDAKNQAIAIETKARHARGQPILIGLRSVETSESLAEHLVGEGLNCHILNARRHKEEAMTVMQAGHRSRITIATNMAGRGTDIRLEAGVADLGGLHVIASEPHESARVDRQLFGRAARQGDPGSVLAIYSGEDPLFVRFLPSVLRRFWVWTMARRGVPGSSGMGSFLGKVMLRWAQYRAQSLASKSRRQVMLAEAEIGRGLGFAKGGARQKAS
ncbi:preprotein translocase subunit SecA [Roseimicrobium gellanilyticum]|uniref:Preprotein translocase subunit SecA n=1 Tax=Roseimicrobium gellanilyticum TaxID=748857 RepID=A0A366HR35_9BACT|nr:prepilin peptidase [Roseimicrobium gellanilyticum]RBP45383.1 preprotein translocase subunit SecA [Roseimicrobium gellanilyticum]